MSRFDVQLQTIVNVTLVGVEASSRWEAVLEGRRQFEEEGIGRRLGLTADVHAARAQYAGRVLRSDVIRPDGADVDRARRNRRSKVCALAMPCHGRQRLPAGSANGSGQSNTASKEA